MSFDALRWLIPAQFIVLLGWWLYQSIVGDTGQWWNPFRVSSFATAITQWGLALLVFFLLNPLLNRHLEKSP